MWDEAIKSTTALLGLAFTFVGFAVSFILLINRSCDSVRKEQDALRATDRHDLRNELQIALIEVRAVENRVNAEFRPALQSMDARYDRMTQRLETKVDSIQAAVNSIAVSIAGMVGKPPA